MIKKTKTKQAKSLKVKSLKTEKKKVVKNIKNSSKVKSVKKAVKSSAKKLSSVKTAKNKNKIVKKLTIKKPAKQNKQKAAKRKNLATQKAKNTKSTTTKAVKSSVQKQQKKLELKNNQESNIIDFKSVVEKKKTEIQLEKRPNEVTKKTTKSLNSIKGAAFKINDFAVYPSHGVGKIVEIENTNIGGQNFSCYLMYFEVEKLTIKIPVSSAHRVGLRALSTKNQIEEVFTILRSGVKKLKGMWSRRAQEYEAKINSGDIMMLAEVLRDLTRDIEDGERSYSERIIYETAIYRLSSEYAAIHGISFEEAKEKVLSVAKDKLGSFDNKPKAKDDDFDFDDELDSSEDEESEDSDDDDDYFDDDDSGSGGKKSVRG